MTKRSSQPDLPLDKFPGSPGFDTSRVHVAGITYFVLGFLLVLGAIMVGLWYFELHLEQPRAQARDSHPKAIPTLPQPLQPSPGHPQLPWEDMAALRAAQERQLHSAGPSRISIDQAIDELLNSGDLANPWTNPATQPYIRPPNETPATPSVENRT